MTSLRKFYQSLEGTHMWTDWIHSLEGPTQLSIGLICGKILDIKGKVMCCLSIWLPHIRPIGSTRIRPKNWRPNHGLTTRVVATATATSVCGNSIYCQRCRWSDRVSDPKKNKWDKDLFVAPSSESCLWLMIDNCRMSFFHHHASTFSTEIMSEVSFSAG